ncbi:hypothetical protein HIDPHFAB_03255 [Nocardioides sp. T2.26MG-1]|nr:hypothetical protein HIDPHFAB_03255 [Nocardioides sp. T2.26MG-1]
MSVDVFLPCQHGKRGAPSIDGVWSETAIFEGAPPASGGATGWGISVSRTGEVQMSAVTASISSPHPGMPCLARSRTPGVRTRPEHATSASPGLLRVQLAHGKEPALSCWFPGRSSQPRAGTLRSDGGGCALRRRDRCGRGFPPKDPRDEPKRHDGPVTQQSSTSGQWPPDHCLGLQQALELIGGRWTGQHPARSALRSPAVQRHPRRRAWRLGSTAVRPAAPARGRGIPRASRRHGSGPGRVCPDLDRAGARARATRVVGVDHPLERRDRARIRHRARPLNRAPSSAVCWLFTIQGVVEA